MAITEETKAKMKASWTEERKQKHAEMIKARHLQNKIDGRVSPLKGIKFTEEHKQKMSAASKNRVKSEEHKLAMSEAHLRRYEAIRLIQTENNCTYREALDIFRSK